MLSFVPRSVWCVFGALIFLSSPAWSETNAAPLNAAENGSSPREVYTLPPVNVLGEAVQPVSGTSIDSHLFQVLPSGGKTLPDLIKILPHVQIAEEARLSTQGGEILPPVFSISGGKYYQNNLLIDGIGNNNLLDPTAHKDVAHGNIHFPKAHPQNQFVSSDLIGEVLVFTHNVSARYGGFTGGVVVSEIRDPLQRLAFRVSGRTTNEDLTSLHVDDPAAFEDSDDVDQQPFFDKFDGLLQMDAPITEQWSALAAVGRRLSILELNHFGGEDYRRTLDNYLLKVVGAPDGDTRISVTGLYTPYEAEYFLSQVNSSDFTLAGNGKSLIFDLEREALSGALWRMTVGGADTRNRREAPNGYYIWRNTVSTDWTDGTAPKAGGYGDVEMSQMDLSVKGSYESPPLEWAIGANRITTGLDLSYVRGTYDRPEDGSQYAALPANVTAVDCQGADACIDGEQFASRQRVFPATDAEAAIAQAAYYLEDEVSLNRLVLRPGLRVSYDSYMHNLNAAPRFSCIWDVWGDASTRVIGGANRYFGKTFLAYKLREAVPQVQRFKRSLDGDDVPTEWVFDKESTTQREKFSELDTPFSNEISLGVEQEWIGGTLSLTGIRRQNRDEFARETFEAEDGTKFYLLNNEGRSDYKSVSLAYKKNWGRHYVQFSLTWQDRESTGEGIDVSLDEDNFTEIVYRGDAIPKWELPADEFNRKWTGTLVYSVFLPYGFEFANIATYRSGYTHAVNSDDDDAEGRSIYIDEDRPSSVILDWKLRWAKEWRENQGLALTLELFNVLNRKVLAGGSDNFETGRQLWLGLEAWF